MKVCLDARLDSSSGGTQQFVMGLAYGLSRLPDGGEEYLFLTNSGEDDWLAPYVSGPCSIVSRPRSFRLRWRAKVRSALPAAASLRSRVRRPGPRRSDGFIENVGVDVMHFPHQSAFLTDLPSIYQPHDLQHLHYPEFFDRADLCSRSATYETCCRRAAAVVMMSSWGKRDLIDRLRIPEALIHVIPGAPMLPLYPSVQQDEDDNVRRKFRLPDDFIFYPAQTWPHKNHLGLLDALAIAKDEHSTVVPLVCSGRLNSFYPRIKSRVDRLALGSQTTFVGFVSPAELVSLYRMSRAVIVPSKFEGWGFPICEAFWSGTPIACSNVTSLPGVAGGAALLFDPNDPYKIASAVRELWQDEQLRAELVSKGRQRVELFTWRKTAMMLRAVYRKVAGRSLSGEDIRLLSSVPRV